MSNHHKINYIEFPAENLSTVKAFYTKVFEWKFTDYGPEYTAFSDGSFDGGFTPGKAVKDAGPLVILYSDNIEETLAAVEKHGGVIHKPIFNFPGGRRFHFIDPAGNELAVWAK